MISRALVCRLAILFTPLGVNGCAGSSGKSTSDFTDFAERITEAPITVEDQMRSSSARTPTAVASAEPAGVRIEIVDPREALTHREPAPLPATRQEARVDDSKDGGNFAAQLIALRSEASARSWWRANAFKLAGVQGAKVSIEPADLGVRGRVYRLKVGPFKSAATAQAVCGQFGVIDPWCGRGHFD